MSLHGYDLGKQEPGRRAGLSGAGIANGSAGGPVVCVVTGGGAAGAGWQVGRMAPGFSGKVLHST
jgi:hypothetical protein